MTHSVNLARRVSEVMTPAPVALPLDTDLTEAARIMRDRGIGDVLVTTNGRLCGLLTDRDIVVRAVAEGRDPARTTLADVCSAGIVALTPDDDAVTAIELMRGQVVRRLPVVEGGRPVGIVSIGDLAIEYDRGSALSDISRAPHNT